MMASIGFGHPPPSGALMVKVADMIGPSNVTNNPPQPGLSVFVPSGLSLGVCGAANVTVGSKKSSSSGDAAGCIVPACNDKTPAVIDVKTGTNLMGIPVTSLV